jgi:hypothetical protein
MMSNKKLTLLGIIAVGMVIWAAIQSHIPSKSKSELSTTGYLIQGLNPAEISSIILGQGKEQVTLKLQNGRFFVVNKDNYPADTKQINDLITKCLDIQTTQFITEKKENHESLGVTEENSRTVIKFLKSDGSLLTGIIIGNNKEAGQGSYVRLANNDKVYVASQAPWISNGAMDYIDEALISADRNNIESVTVTSPEGQYCLKKKENSQDIILENIPAGKKLKDSESKSVFNTATDLRFTDVQKKPSDINESSFDRQYICRLADSTVYTLNIAKKDTKTFVICKAEFTDTVPVTIKKEGESEEELKKKEAKLIARDKAKEFNEKHQGWLFEIADWKAQNLTKKLSDLLEDEKKPEQKEQPKAEEKQEEEKKPQELEKINEPNTVEADLSEDTEE